jgi:hypothetical protein
MTNEEYRIQAMDWFKENVIHLTFIDKWYFDYLLDKTFLKIPLALWIVSIIFIAFYFIDRKIRTDSKHKLDLKRNLPRLIMAETLLTVLIVIPLSSIVSNNSGAETLYLSESEFFKNLPMDKRIELSDKLDSHFAQYLYEVKPTSPRLTRIKLDKFKEIIDDVFPLEVKVTSTRLLDNREEVLRKLNYYRLENVRSSESDW